MSNHVGTSGCGGNCGGTCGAMRKKSGTLSQFGVGFASKENWAFVCAAEKEDAKGTTDEASFEQYYQECLNEYDPANVIVDPCPPGDQNIPQGYDPLAACSSAQVIRYVQMISGNPNPDGKWGPESQKWLDASGRSFMDIANEAGGCTGASPSYVTPGPGPGPEPGKTVDIEIVEEKKLYWGLPLWAWIAIGTGAVVLGGTGAYFAFRKDESKTGVGGRDLALEGAEPRAKLRRNLKRSRNSKGRFVSKKMSYTR